MSKPAKYDPKRGLITTELMAWCRDRYGYGSLCLAAEADFRAYHVDQVEQGKPKKYANWSRAFKNYITWASPAGRFYSARQWEGWLTKAKEMENGPRRKRQNFYHPDPDSNKEFNGKVPNRPASKHVVESAKQTLSRLLNGEST